MFIWGSGHKTIQKSVTDNIICSECAGAIGHSVVVDYDYSHLYWIFRSVKNVQTYLVCENCSHVQGAEAKGESGLFAKVGGNPIPYTDRFGGVVFVLLIVGAVAFFVLSQASRDSSGDIVRAGNISAFDIQLGDCLSDEGLKGGADGTEISGVHAVPCEDPHDDEVFAVLDLELDTFPEGDAMFDIAFDECLTRFEPFVGRGYQSSSLDIQVMYPTLQSWNEANDREVVCVLFDVDHSTLEGSMKGSGI